MLGGVGARDSAEFGVCDWTSTQVRLRRGPTIAYCSLFAAHYSLPAVAIAGTSSQSLAVSVTSHLNCELPQRLLAAHYQLTIDSLSAHYRLTIGSSLAHYWV